MDRRRHSHYRDRSFDRHGRQRSCSKYCIKSSADQYWFYYRYINVKTAVIAMTKATKGSLINDRARSLMTPIGCLHESQWLHWPKSRRWSSRWPATATTCACSCLQRHWRRLHAQLLCSIAIVGGEGGGPKLFPLLCSRLPQEVDFFFVGFS